MNHLYITNIEGSVRCLYLLPTFAEVSVIRKPDCARILFGIAGDCAPHILQNHEPRNALDRYHSEATPSTLSEMRGVQGQECTHSNWFERKSPGTWGWKRWPCIPQESNLSSLLLVSRPTGRRP